MGNSLFIRAYLKGRKAPSWVNTDRLELLKRCIIVFPVIAKTQEELHEFFKERCKHFVKMPWW